jgi:GTPase-associated protein 1
MAFRQLYYTSCEHGLLGYGGFQFNAATPGVSPQVMREIEDLTSYEPPRWMAADPDPGQLAGYPIAFSHAFGSDGSVIVARVVFAGADYTGRPGNYFAHALVTERPPDFGGVLPAQLWEAPLWQTAPATAPDLPELPAPVPPGPLDRVGVQAFLAGYDPAILPRLLSAAGRAIAGDQPVLLAGPDTAANASWIAAVSYLLGERLARRMTFTTYSHRPAYCRHHLIGVVPGEEPLPDGFYVCDTRGNAAGSDTAHPLAALLNRVGVVQAEALWQQAEALWPQPVRSGPPAEDLDGWHPVVAAAALLRGDRLDPRQDVTVVVDWLAQVSEPLPDTRRVPQALLDGYGDFLSEDQLYALHPLAVSLGSEAAILALEGMLVSSALAHFARGEPTGQPVELSHPLARSRAGIQCLGLMITVAPERIPDLLGWARGAGAELGPAGLREYGAALDPYSMDTHQLAAILRGQPDIVAGFLTFLDGKPPVAYDLFKEPGLFEYGDVITQEDLRDRPELSRQWVLGARARGTLSPPDALRELWDLGPRQITEHMLRQLWPDGCPAADLLVIVPPLYGLGQYDWLGREVAAALRTENGHDGIALAEELKRYPELDARLPDDVRASAARLADAERVLRDARARVAAGDTAALRQLYRMFAGADKRTRTRLIEKLPDLLGEAERLEDAWPGCPAPVRQEFCRRLRLNLSPLHANPQLAVWVFRGRQALAEAARNVEELDLELEQVLKWPGGKRRALHRAMASDDAEAFDQWCEERRGGMVTKLRGMLRTRRDGD